MHISNANFLEMVKYKENIRPTVVTNSKTHVYDLSICLLIFYTGYFIGQGYTLSTETTHYSLDHRKFFPKIIKKEFVIIYIYNSTVRE